MGDNTNPDDRSPLLPDRYPQQDFFVCDVFDAAPKGDMASMEHPLFSISTKPDLTAREYRNGRSEEHTSELQSLMRISYAVFCLKKKNSNIAQRDTHAHTMPTTQLESTPYTHLT